MKSAYSVYQSNPVTQQAVVTVNAGFDRHFCNYRKNLIASNKVPATELHTSDDNCYTVQQRELVFRLKPMYDDKTNKPRGTGVNDIALKVFSSINNFFMPSKVMPLTKLPQDWKSQVMSAVSFVGVAVTPADYTNHNFKDNLAVQVAGSCTIANTGSSSITAGQLVCWDIPEMAKVGKKRALPAGEPLDKYLFATVPLDDILEDKKTTTRSYDFARFFVKAHSLDVGKTATDDEVKNHFIELTQNSTDFEELIRFVCMNYEQMVRSRIIGIALSSAQPGDNFDILLQSGH
jgi:hypothetical protein